MKEILVLISDLSCDGMMCEISYGVKLSDNACLPVPRRNTTVCLDLLYTINLLYIPESLLPTMTLITKRNELDSHYYPSALCGGQLYLLVSSSMVFVSRDQISGSLFTKIGYLVVRQFPNSRKRRPDWK